MLEHRGAHPNRHFKPAQKDSRHFIATKISDRISLKVQKKIPRKEGYPSYSVVSVDILVHIDRGVHPPEAILHFPPFQISPYFRKDFSTNFPILSRQNF